MQAENNCKSTDKKEDKPKKKWINPLRDRTRVVPFIVPNQEERMCALGSLAGEKWRIKKSLQAIIGDFQPIKKPEPGQNLYFREEQAQGFPLFSSMYRNHIDTQSQIIYIATFHCKLSQEMIKRIKINTKKFFHGAKVKTHRFNSKIDLSQFDPMQSQNGETYYDAAKMNFFFTKKLPPKCFSIHILTNLLIYNGDNPVQELCEKWVFGLGSIKDRTCITSVQESVKQGYGNPLPQDVSYSQEQDMIFLEKVVNHQICHTFGMRHCVYFTCLMNGSSGYQEAARKVKHLCPICVRKLQYAIGFDFAERYQKIADQKTLKLASQIRDVVDKK